MAIVSEPSRQLLDTCTLIDLPQLEALGIELGEIAISSITIAELSFGVATAKTSLQAVQRSHFQTQVQKWFDPLPFDSAAALKYGELVALVREQDRSPRSRRIDLMIAAVAASNGLELVTANDNDFLGLESLVKIVRVTLPRRVETEQYHPTH